MKKDLFNTIVSDILSDDFFSDYKFTRCLILKLVYTLVNQLK